MTDTIEKIIGFKSSKELAESVYTMLDSVKETINLKIGVNEVTKSIEKGNVKLVVIAEDVNPVELIMHLPALCKEKKILFCSVPSRQELGISSGLKVSSSCIAIEDENTIKENSKIMSEIAKLCKL